MNWRNVITSMFFCITFYVTGLHLNAQPPKGNDLKMTDQYTEASFPMVAGNKTADIIVDPAETDVVRIAAEALRNDIGLVTGAKTNIQPNIKNASPFTIIVGTIGTSPLISQLEKKRKLSLTRVSGKWETFTITLVDQPLKNIEKALVIAGSDRRGTAFGIFELSRMMGVSPLSWWADVTPQHKDNLYVSGTCTEGPPSIKYRGIFINDEDWGMQPWAAKKMDTDIKDIGPKTYAQIFELLLRMKANFIWPAMHPCTKAFYYYPENPKTADRYAIIVGSSHCEPILRNNVFEWTENFEHEYGTKPGEWRYDTNKEQVHRYWEDRAKQSANYESVYTVGMRGVHDGSMPGPKSKPEKIKLLEQIITDQRDMLSTHKKKPITDIPQIFCPYKEVLQLYQGGLKLPDDVTIAWSDDNHGYIRQLSDPEEQKRSGGSGVYYHVSYWGAPHDYLWLCSTSPALISYELTKAYEYGASRLWVINVGDLKPAEMETQFSMDLAWDIHAWAPGNAYQYAEKWAAETFGEKYAKPIANIKSEYYRLAQSGKPEHLGMLAFSETIAAERINDYQAMAAEATALGETIPQQLKDAYFQLVLYPVKSACLMNEKTLYARKSTRLANTNEPEAVEYGKKAKKAYEQIKQLTQTYNDEVAGGKWSGIMSWHPRNLQVFFMPQVAPQAAHLVADSVKYRIVTKKEYQDSIEGASASGKVAAAPSHIFLAATDFKTKKDFTGGAVQAIPGLGLGNSGISIMPYTMPPIASNNIKDAPYVDYAITLNRGKHIIQVKCLPTQGIHKGRSLRYGVSLNNDSLQVIDVNNPKEDRIWKENVLRGFSVGETTHHAEKDGEATIRIYLLDPGLVVNRIEVM